MSGAQRATAGAGGPRRRGARWSIAAASGLAGALAAAPAAACSVCFGTQDTGSPLVSSARLGVFLLLAITAAVLGGFVKFFLYLRRQARRAEIDGVAAEWAQLQRSTPPC